MTVKDINLLDSSDTTLSGYPAHKVIYVGKPDGVKDLKVIQVWAQTDSKVYVITFAADLNSYSNYLGMVNVMLNSFTIIS